jgi:hypothetical protein
MKMLLVLADASRLDDYRAGLDALGSPGHTVCPVLAGEGRTGLRAGDRVHPGAMVVVFSVLEDAQADAMLAGLMDLRGRLQDVVTRFFVLPVERSA